MHPRDGAQQQHLPLKGPQLLVDALGVLDGGLEYTRCLNALIARGLYVERFYGSSVRTCRGQFATLFSALPSISGKEFLSPEGQDLDVGWGVPGSGRPSFIVLAQVDIAPTIAQAVGVGAYTSHFLGVSMLARQEQEAFHLSQRLYDLNQGLAAMSAAAGPRLRGTHMRGRTGE